MERALLVELPIIRKTVSCSSGALMIKIESWLSTSIEKQVAHDITAAASYAADLKKLIREGGYDQKQLFNVDETGLFWKRLPTRTYVS